MSIDGAVLKRVSTDLTRQDITNQDGDVARAIEANDIHVVRTFELAKSAYHGAGIADTLAEILADVRNGLYTTVIAAMTSRFERRGYKALFRFMLDLDAVGGRLIAADDPHFGDLDSDMGFLATFFAGKKDFDYSDAISRNVNRANRKTDAEGVFRGSVPNGYMLVGGKRSRSLVPDLTGARWTETHKGCPKGATCRSEGGALVEGSQCRSYRHPTSDEIARAIRDCASGTSAKRLAERLNMDMSGMRYLLNNGVYSTGVYKIKRRSDGVTVQFKTAPLVTVAEQDAAVAAMEARRWNDTVSSRGLFKDDFSGALWCGLCESEQARVYRCRNGSGVRYYRCSECGKSAKAASADAEVDRVLRESTAPWLEVVPGEIDTTAADLERARIELTEVSGRGLSLDETIAEVTRLHALIEDLSSKPSKPFSWVQRMRGLFGDHWAELDPQGRREWLQSGQFRVLIKAAPGRRGEVVAEIEYGSTGE
jgi:hypothetical protein